MGKYNVCCKKCILSIIHIFSINCCKKKKNVKNLKVPNIPDKKDSISLDIIESDIEDNIEEIEDDIEEIEDDIEEIRDEEKDTEKDTEKHTEQYKNAIKEYKENIIEEEWVMA